MLATMLMIGKLVGVAVSIVKAGKLAMSEISGVFDKVKDQPVTPELVEQVRVELLTKAKIPHAVDDEFIRKELEALGIDPDSLKI